MKVKKFKRVLWAGKDKKYNLIAYQHMFQTRKEAKAYSIWTGYEVVKVTLQEN